MSQSHYDKFQCPICGDTSYPLLPVGSEFEVLKQLKVIGAGNRMQKCHRCHSNDRDRLVFLYLRDTLKVFDDSHRKLSILHVAPEECIAQKFLSDKSFSYLAIDSFEHGYTYPKYIKKMDLLSLDVPDESIDIIICNHVLQDIKDDLAAMKEIYRVLKYDGIAILQVPISPVLDTILEKDIDLTEKDCETYYGQRFHKRIYNENGYVNRLKSVGFGVQTPTIRDRQSIYSLNQNEKIFVAKKINYAQTD